jgi:hypothetical protein
MPLNGRHINKGLQMVYQETGINNSAMENTVANQKEIIFTRIAS